MNDNSKVTPGQEQLLELFGGISDYCLQRHHSKAQVLLVEDDENLASDIKDILKVEGLNCLVANRALVGEKLAILTNPELLILDRNLPDGDGLAVCLALRAAKLDSKILILTGLTEREQVVDGLNRGADDYLGKPFHFQELIARVRALLARPLKYGHNCLRYAHLTIDLLNNEVLVAGQKVDLFPIDRALLEYLMRRPETLISAGEIINAVWRADEAVSSESVRASILRLRKVTHREGFPALLKSKYGAGYMLSVAEI